MKKTLKKGTIALSFLLGASILAQTSAYAKEKPSKSVERPSKVESREVKAVHNSKEEKTVPFGLTKMNEKFTLPPVIKVGGIVIPVNAITKAFAANLTWDKDNQTVTITRENETIVINMNTKIVTVNGTEVTFDKVSNNGAFVPLKLIVQSLGIDLNTTGEEQTAGGTETSGGTQTSGGVTGTGENTSTTGSVIQVPTTSDTQASTGTDVQAPTTSDTQTSTGTDVQTPTTTDVQTPSNTDTQASTTTDAQATTSTDTQTSTSTDVQVPSDNTVVTNTQN